MYSLIIPVYKNEDSIADLLAALSRLAATLPDQLEVVFVVDGSPDRSLEYLRNQLPTCPFQSQLVCHSRNFGSFEAVRTGLEHAQGPLFAVMAADLQETPELVVKMFQALSEGADVVVGTRESRNDPFFQKMSASFFWWAYRKWVQPEMPVGGVDVFACNQVVRDRLLSIREANTTLVGLLLWLGYNRREIPYTRLSRKKGKSAWTLARKLRYLSNSIFAFSDLPIRLMISFGALGIAASLILGFCVFVAKLRGDIPVPGYAATVLTLLFFGGINSLGLGIVGSYVWRAFENTKGRPSACVLSKQAFRPSR